MKWSRNKAASVVALGAAAALVLGACSSDPEAPEPDGNGGETTEPEGNGDDPDEVTLVVAHWGDFGLNTEGDSFIEEYQDLNPHVTIELSVGDFQPTHDALQQYLIAGSGAADVAAIDADFIVQFREQADSFVNLLDVGGDAYADAYLPWKWEQSLSPDGSVQIGVGTDVGPLAMCYRHDLFEEAGVPFERDEVSAAWGDSWEDFIAFGQEYVAASGSRFIDNATNVFMPVLGQQDIGFFTTDNELQLEPGAKIAFDTAVAAIDAEISAGAAAWSEEWNAGFANGDFAVLACPAWMRGHIRNTAPDTAGLWDIADIPGDGGNWGGSFWAIPAQTEHPEEAWKFVEWLIQPEQQLRIFNNVGNLPSQVALLESDEIQNSTDEFFNNVPDGQVFARSALALTPQYAGPGTGSVRTALENALNAVQGGELSSADAWDVAVANAEEAIS